MSFARVSDATTAYTSGATSLTLGKPGSVAADDILFALLASYNRADATTVPAGWAELGKNVDGATYLWTL